MDERQPQTNLVQRIDKWLFFARISKSRTLAQEQIAAGLVRINGKPARQPSASVRSGDKVEISLAHRDLVLIVKLTGTRRGPYEEARLLYEDQSPPEAEREKLTAFEQAQRQPGSGRPTKRERRQIDRLFESD
ncbi:RNA-binding S4 domain-containing protein [Allorhizobium sp. BGMRC 0089]|uniref:RNA-binding S4 domain-containing protein n=1 Tax=Allorhizobium sonneratiae TaxID=2934936 RepID=UPI0020345C95|nr:RNA-binding S4 domain-containing protein [Allorhizobium sonneratiae]MCM2294369.1 RNA-binding S4 domain-containing protein [Allorhizobium sonneratiae]